jgi:hypothetical protein
MITAGMVLTGCFAAGGVLGTAYLALLYRAVLLLTQESGHVRRLPYHVARVGLVAGGYWAFAQFGAGALLSGFAGFQAARAVALRLEARR